MYLEHFGLRMMPFSITPGIEFVFASRAHQEALNTLLFAVQGGEGFVKITGEVGTGKTMLCRRFLDILQQQGTTSAYIPNPAMEPIALLHNLADELGIVLQGQTEYQLRSEINQKLIEVAQQNGNVVVCIDEAQSMSAEALECVRLLSNLETNNRKLLQIVLFAQPELDEKLAQPNLRQMQQRITFEYTLHSMSLRELERYVSHRLMIAGYRGVELFSPGALKRLFRASNGTPRLINILAHKALLCAYGEGGQTVLPNHVNAAILDTRAAYSTPTISLRLGFFAYMRQLALNFMGGSYRGR